MTGPVRSIPLYPWLPLIISLLLVTMVLADRWLSYKQVMIPRETERQTAMLQQTSNRMWLQISSLMIEGNLGATENYLTSFIANPGFKTLALINQGKVILANRFALKGQKVISLKCYMADRILPMQQANKVSLYPLSDTELCVFIPVYSSDDDSVIRPQRENSFLLIRYSLQPAINQLRDEVFHISHFSRGLLFALITGMLLTFLISYIVLRPLKAVRFTMKQFCQGKHHSRIRLTGRGEFSDLGDNFNQLVAQLSTAEQMLKDSEQRWIYALDAAGDGVWDWDTRTDKVFFSAQWKKMLGFDDNEIGDHLEEWSERVHPEDLPAAMAALEAHLQGRTPVYRNEHRLRCKNGEYKWVLDRGMVFERDAQGAAIRVIGTHSDITTQKKTQKQLQESQQRFELAMQGATDGLWDWQIDIHQVYYSPRWKQMLGYQDHELKNEFSTWERLVHKDDIAVARKELQDCITGKKDHYEVEFRMQHKQGGWLHILSRAIVVTGDNSRVERLVGTHMDITEIRQVQTQLEQSQAQLEKLAFYDVLTGLPNRRLLEDRLQQQLAAVRRNDELMAVAMMDLDGFKQVNDTKGHDTGDELLKEIAERLKLCIREVDTVARLGGDEFVLILSKLQHREDVVPILERVLNSVSLPCILKKGSARVSASIGISFYPAHGETGDLLLRRADIAMYASKNSGRNQFNFYQAYMEYSDPGGKDPT